MLAKSLLVFASVACTLASPIFTTVGTIALNYCEKPEPQLPMTGGATELPNPPESSKLFKIALGLGIQNYSCLALGGPTVATGALAMLYDITSLYPGQSPGSLSEDDFQELSANILHNHEIPLNFNSSTEGRVDPAHLGADSKKPFPANKPLQVPGMRPIPFLGHHYFDSQGVPVFTIDNDTSTVAAKKENSVDAPASADAGVDGTGAVSWLFLSAKPTSVGPLKYIYRVLTAGGNTHSCSKGTGGDSTSYATTYWFYV